MRVCALDLGGTRLKAGVVTDRIPGEVVAHDAPADGSREALLRSLSEAARAVLGAGGRPDGAGLCVPGLVDEHGIVVSLPGKHAGIEGQDLPQVVREATGAERVVVVNDAVAYATGEATAGAGRGASRVVVVTIGTGVGVTVIDGGAPVTRGTLGGGILGGFIPISEATDGPLDSNGHPGTIEALCAAPRLAEACGTATVEEAYVRVGHGDPAAHAGVAAYRAHLVRALTALASAHAPDRIVLGGGPMVAGTPVLDGVEAEVNARMFGTYRVQVALAALGDAAALAGLAHLVEAG